LKKGGEIPRARVVRNSKNISASRSGQVILPREVQRRGVFAPRLFIYMACRWVNKIRTQITISLYVSERAFSLSIYLPTIRPARPELAVE
jgi:hypothetical protein